MQKLVQRAEQASRTAARRSAKEKGHKQFAEKLRAKMNAKPLRRFEAGLVKEARKNRHEDWEAGALAPRRDVGERAETYGSISFYQHQAVAPQRKDRPKEWTIAEGDRVVMTAGRDRGKIGRVQQTSEEHASVQIRDVNMTDVKLPEWIVLEDNYQASIQALPSHVPVKHVKLVFPLPDPHTGVPRDVVIDRLHLEGRSLDTKPGEKAKRQRVITGTNTVIPWPEKLDPKYDDHDDDTRRMAVEEQTFRPVLLHPPMPMSVIDELRNKYSKFRTRHDYDYVQKKDAEEARIERRKELGKTMKLPVQELAELRAQQKKAEERELTQEQLAKIGEVIAAEKARARDYVQTSS